MSVSPLQLFQQAILKLADKGTERTYYPPFCNFLHAFFEEQGTKDVIGTAEESSKNLEDGVGFPDITVRQKERLVGWIEVKLPNDDIGNKKFEKQFKKYKDSLENMIFTNFRQWELWQWDTDGKSKKVDEITFDVRNFAVGAEKTLINFLVKFFEGQAYDVRTPKQLALALARKTKLLSQQVEENFDEKEEDSDLYKLKKTFQETLIQNISAHQFSNMVAETLAYSLFLAGLEYADKHPTQSFTLTTAIDYLPKNVPILRDLYDLVKRVSITIPNIHKSAESLVDQINSADIERIRHKLTEHKPGEDPVIQFYEPFLNEYDPKEREARGVYYTPKPVVDFIVRSVDYLLETKFGKKDGIANEDVNILDPATGTGTFLMSAIQQVYARIKKQNGALGEDIVRKKFTESVLNHILKHFYGFELLVAPYAIAHLKLTLESERLGFNWEETWKDNDSTNDRFQVFLANTLDNPDAPPKNFFGFESISKESEKARNVKKNKPILAILGNPPYSLVSSNLLPHMRKLVDKYKTINGVKIKERGALQMEKILNDDYVKFIAFAQEKIVSQECGIIAYINNHTFLENPTMRAMRYNLLNSFSEIYIIDLHGNLKRKKDGVEDENVFNIQQGVSINIFIKKERNASDECKVFHTEIRGKKIDKFNYLMDNNLMDIDFKELNPKEPFYFLNHRNTEKNEEYFSDNYFTLTDIFPNKSIGFFTSRDKITIGESKKDIEPFVDIFKSSTKSNEDLCRELNIPVKKGWNIYRARELINSEKNIEEYYIYFLHRPFDKKTVFYHKSLVWSMSRPIMSNVLHKKNLMFCASRQLAALPWQHCFCSNSAVELCYITNKTKEGNHVFPLYLYPEIQNKQSNFINEAERKPNISEKFIKAMEKKLEMHFAPDGLGGFKQLTALETPPVIKSEEDYFTPEDIFYYAYAVFHCPTYRTRYAEQLKIDFPRLPLTNDAELFKKLVKKGNELVNLHLLGENPFDDSETIFDDNSQWHVSVGGTKPENTEDWKVSDVRYEPTDKRVYVNPGQYFEGIEKEVWEFMIGGYQVCDKWLKDRRKAERCLNGDDLLHYMKIVVSLRETQRVMKEIDTLIPKWPME